MLVPINRLRVHPRRHEFFSEVSEGDEEFQYLVQSIAKVGMIQAITVRPLEGTDEYEVLSGYRRFRAAKELGWTDVWVALREADDDLALRMLIAANWHMRMLSPMDITRILDGRVLDTDFS